MIFFTWFCNACKQTLPYGDSIILIIIFSVFKLPFMRQLAFLTLLIFFGCKSPGDKTPSSNIQDTTKSVAPTLSGKLSIYQPKKLEKKLLPTSIKFKGDLEEAWQWTDKLGDNILVTTLVAPFPYKGKDELYEDASTAELHAFHYIKKDSAYKLLWKISDAEKICRFDITCEFIKDALTITDLNNNGIAETVLQYLIVCRSDVSPAYKKLIMHEDTVKYSLRGRMCEPDGTSRLCVTEKDLNLSEQPAAKEEWEEYTRLFGRYENENEFKNAPPSFLAYARKQWLKHVKESFD